MDAILRKFYNEIKSNSRVGEHSDLLQAIEKEIELLTPAAVAPEDNEKDFNTGYEGTFEGRAYEVIDQGMFGNGNVDWRILEFKDNGKRLSINKSALVKAQVKKNTEDLPIKQWHVPVTRIGYAHRIIDVSAKTEEEAISLAIDEAGGEDFSEKSSEYEAHDGAILIQ